MHTTQSVLLTMGLDAASAHPELVVDTKNIWNSMKRNFDTVAARRAFGRSDVLALAHLSKAMGRLAQKGIYLPMTKEMLEGEIRATADISGMQNADHEIGRLSLTPMGEFSYQRKEIAEGEDLEANIPSYNYNQGVLTKLKKRLHRMGKRHAAQLKGDVKALAKEKMALEEEFSKIIKELTDGNFYAENQDGDDGGDDDGDDGSGGPKPKKPKFNSSAPKGHIIPGLNLGGSVSKGGLGPPPSGGGDSRPGTGGGGAGGSVITNTGAPNHNPMDVRPGDVPPQASLVPDSAGTKDAIDLRPKDRGIRKSEKTMSRILGKKAATNKGKQPLYDPTQFGHLPTSVPGSSSAADSMLPPQTTIERPPLILGKFAINLPQQTTDADVNMSGKGTGSVTANLNNVTSTTINLTNNSQVNEAFRESNIFSSSSAGKAEEALVNEAAHNNKITYENQSKAPVIASGRGLVAANTTQRNEIANVGPEAIPASAWKQLTIEPKTKWMINENDASPRKVPTLPEGWEQWNKARIDMGKAAYNITDPLDNNFTLHKNTQDVVTIEKAMKEAEFLTQNNKSTSMFIKDGGPITFGAKRFLDQASTDNKFDVYYVSQALISGSKDFKRRFGFDPFDKFTKSEFSEHTPVVVERLAESMLDVFIDVYAPDQGTAFKNPKKAYAFAISKLGNYLGLNAGQARVLIGNTLKDLIESVSNGEWRTKSLNYEK